MLAWDTDWSSKATALNVGNILNRWWFKGCKTKDNWISTISPMRNRAGCAGRNLSKFSLLTWQHWMLYLLSVRTITESIIIHHYIVCWVGIPVSTCSSKQTSRINVTGKGGNVMCENLWSLSEVAVTDLQTWEIIELTGPPWVDNVGRKLAWHYMINRLNRPKGFWKRFSPKACNLQWLSSSRNVMWPSESIMRLM